MAAPEKITIHNEPIREQRRHTMKHKPFTKIK